MYDLSLLKNELPFALIDNRECPYMLLFKNIAEKQTYNDISEYIYRNFRLSFHSHVLGWHEIEGWLYSIAEQLGYYELISFDALNHEFSCKQELFDLADEMYSSFKTIDGYTFYMAKVYSNKYKEWEDYAVEIKQRARIYLLDSIICYI